MLSPRRYHHFDTKDVEPGQIFVQSPAERTVSQMNQPDLSHQFHKLNSDRLGNVLMRRHAEIADLQIEPRLDLGVGVLGEADRPRLGHAIAARRR